MYVCVIHTQTSPPLSLDSLTGAITQHTPLPLNRLLQVKDGAELPQAMEGIVHELPQQPVAGVGGVGVLLLLLLGAARGCVCFWVCVWWLMLREGEKEGRERRLKERKGIWVSVRFSLSIDPTLNPRTDLIKGGRREKHLVLQAVGRRRHVHATAAVAIATVAAVVVVVVAGLRETARRAAAAAAAAAAAVVVVNAAMAGRRRRRRRRHGPGLVRPQLDGLHHRLGVHHRVRLPSVGPAVVIVWGRLVDSGGWVSGRASVVLVGWVCVWGGGFGGWVG